MLAAAAAAAVIRTGSSRKHVFHQRRVSRCNSLDGATGTVSCRRCEFVSFRGTTVLSFLPARRYASAGLCDSDVSVHPSVCLSAARRYCA